MIQPMSMNRKQRRLQEKKLGKKTTIKSRENATLAQAKKAQGDTLKSAGKDAEAIPYYKEALKLDNSLADIHFALAMMARTKPELELNMKDVNRLVKHKSALQKSYQDILHILKSRKQYDEAMIGQEELCKLMPDSEQEQVNLALLLSMAERKAEASTVLARLMKKNPANKRHKAMFVSICAFTGFKAFDPVVKEAIQNCFDNIYESNLLKMFLAWITTAKYDPDYPGLSQVEPIVTDESFEQWAENTPSDDMSFFRSKFFLDGIRLLIIGDIVMEKFLVRMRKWLCLNAQRLAEENRMDFFEPFLMALAEQCFFNEYVFIQTPEEEAVVQKLEEALRTGTHTGMSEAQAYALIGCYKILHDVFPDRKAAFEKLAKDSGSFANLAKTQFFDQEEEDRIKKSLRVFGEMENQVSRDVQNQYEENPYPRWVSVMNFPAISEHLPVGERERLSARSVLIAGCGTGRQAIDTAANYADAHITAIDLSRASLAYAQRKANESGLADKIDFIHADILSMKQWPEQFDVIESSGVLHHMEDPFEGWRILTEKLRPGGFFKVGLYSETARKAYVEGQEMARKHNFPSTVDGIRAFRAKILELPTTDETRKLITGSGDFYTTSLVRDLIFHVQEHRMNLPQIQDMMDRLGLECVSFVIPDIITIKRYDKKFPENPARNSLMNWHTIEQKHPLTFIAMYQFWCRKVKDTK